MAKPDEQNRYRSLNVNPWAEPWFQERSQLAMLLLMNLNLNQAMTPCGALEISPVAIAGQLRSTPEAVEAALVELSDPDLTPDGIPRVMWWPRRRIVWVRAFYRQQGRNPGFEIAARRAAAQCPPEVRDEIHAVYPQLQSEQPVLPMDEEAPAKGVSSGNRPPPVKPPVDGGVSGGVEPPVKPPVGGGAQESGVRSQSISDSVIRSVERLTGGVGGHNGLAGSAQGPLQPVPPQTLNASDSGGFETRQVRTSELAKLASLTGDTHSHGGFGKLYDLACRYGHPDLWDETVNRLVYFAEHGFPARRDGQPPNRGAWFTAVMAVELHDRGVYEAIPGAKEEAALAKSAMQALREQYRSLDDLDIGRAPP